MKAARVGERIVREMGSSEMIMREVSSGERITQDMSRAQAAALTVRVQAATAMYRAWQMSVDTDTLQRRTNGLVLADVRVMSDTLSGM